MLIKNVIVPNFKTAYMNTMISINNVINEKHTIDKTFFEQHASEILVNAGLNKSRFANKIGVARQNVQKIFETKNVFKLMQVSKVLGVSISYLITGDVDSLTKVNGYLEVNGTIYKVQTKSDLLNLIEKI